MFHTILVKLCIIFTVFKNVDLTIPQEPCPFNTQCICSPPGGPAYTAICKLYEPVFPTFTEYDNCGIEILVITARYGQKTGLTVPPNAFYELKSMKLADVRLSFIYPDCWNAPRVTIAPGAYNTENPNAISIVFFGNVNIPTLQAGTFDGIAIEEIQFFGTCLGVISDNAFAGLTVYSLQVGNVALPMTSGYSMSPLSLNGITFRGNNTKTSFTYLSLTDQEWPAFKLVNSVNLMLNNNNFTSVPNFAFCNCTASNSCWNSVLISINLANNNIQRNVFGNAFANLPNLQYLSLASNNIDLIDPEMASALWELNSLETLDLSRNQLQTVSLALPKLIWLSLAFNRFSSVPQQLSGSLKFLDLSNNEIQELMSNDFRDVQLLQEVHVDSNPITAIDPGAFYGLNSVTALSFQYLNDLGSVDLLLAYGMANLTSISFQYCALLQTVVVSDLSKLPSTLSQIHFNYMPMLKTIDTNLDSWLEQSETNYLDLSTLDVFDCDQDYQWMAKHAVCQPLQINSVGSKCSNGTLFLTFLYSFQPSCL